MTVSTTTRLGIYRWDSASDSFTRLHLDTSHANLESKVAGFSSGTRASAAAAYEGFFHFGSGETLSYCNGSAWFDIGKSGTAVELDGTLSSGSGTDLALANHKHSIADNVIDNDMMKDNAINSDEIVDGAVKEAKIFGGAVTNDKLASSGLSATKFTTGTLDCSAVTVSNLPASAVPNLNASKINDGTFDSGRIPTIALNTGTSGNYVEEVAVSGTGLSLSGSAGEGATFTLSHANTSSQLDSTNSGGTVIQSVGLDGFGHVDNLEIINLDGRYYQESEINTKLSTVYGDSSGTSGYWITSGTAAPNDSDGAPNGSVYLQYTS